MNAKSFKSFTQILNYLIKYFKVVVIAAITLGILAGIYRVESSEVAVVLRFGRITGASTQQQIKQPGIHFALPFLIDEVIKVPVQAVLEKEIVTHFTTGNESTIPATTTTGTASAAVDDALLQISSTVDGTVEGNIASTPSATPIAPVQSMGYLLTGDSNIVLIKAMVKYQISNAVQYALYSNDVDGVIDGVVSSELTHLVTHMDIDSVLTSGKAQLAYEIMTNAQRALDDLQIGVMLTNVELTEIVPPGPTKQAFEDVISASVNKETMIQTARDQSATRILEAEAVSTNYTQDALYNQSIRLTRAHNEIAEFNGLYDQYMQDPLIIINGTFRQRVSAVLKQMGGSIIVPDNDSAPTLILP